MKVFKKIVAALLLASAVYLCGCTGLVEHFYPEQTTGEEQSVFVPVDVEDGSVVIGYLNGDTLRSRPRQIHKRGKRKLAQS